MREPHVTNMNISLGENSLHIFFKSQDLNVYFYQFTNFFMLQPQRGTPETFPRGRLTSVYFSTINLSPEFMRLSRDESVKVAQPTLLSQKNAKQNPTSCPIARTGGRIPQSAGKKQCIY